jgi:hypothetical protein
VSVPETILYFAVPPVGLYLVIVLLVVGPRMARRPRYRSGQPWTFEPMWFTANPKGAQLPVGDESHSTGAHSTAVRSNLERGGARGSW